MFPVVTPWIASQMCQNTAPTLSVIFETVIMMLCWGSLELNLNVLGDCLHLYTIPDVYIRISDTMKIRAAFDMFDGTNRGH